MPSAALDTDDALGFTVSAGATAWPIASSGARPRSAQVQPSQVRTASGAKATAESATAARECIAADGPPAEWTIDVPCNTRPLLLLPRPPPNPPPPPPPSPVQIERPAVELALEDGGWSLNEGPIVDKAWAERDSVSSCVTRRRRGSTSSTIRCSCASKTKREESAYAQQDMLASRALARLSHVLLAHDSETVARAREAFGFLDGSEVPAVRHRRPESARR